MSISSVQDTSSRALPAPDTTALSSVSYIITPIDYGYNRKLLHHQIHPQEEPHLKDNSESESLGLVEAVACTEQVGGAMTTPSWPPSHEDRTVVSKAPPGLSETGLEPGVSGLEPGVSGLEPGVSGLEPGVSPSEAEAELAVAMSRSEYPSPVEESADSAEERRGGAEERRGGAEEGRGGAEERRVGVEENRGGVEERRGEAEEKRGGAEERGEAGKRNVTSNPAGSTPISPEGGQGNEPQSLALLPLNTASLPLLRSLAESFTSDTPPEKEPPGDPPAGARAATSRQPREPDERPAAVLPSLVGRGKEDTTDVEGVKPAESSTKGVASVVTIATKTTTEGEREEGAVFPYPLPEPVSIPSTHS